MKELEEFQAGKKSSEKLVWTESLKQQFENSKRQVTDLDELYLPKPDDQLVITTDWSKKGISGTLWGAFEVGPPKVVARFSARLDNSLEKMINSEVRPSTLPCDGEMTAVYVAAKSPTFCGVPEEGDKCRSRNLAKTL